jgi:two-component system cell cycle response regulator
MARILIVDDSRTNLMFEEMLLHAAGFETVAASNGKEALVSVPQVLPDLIIMDIMMPIMDGIEACRHLKANPETRHIPVVMMTAKDEDEKIEEARAAGCDDISTKPIQKQEFLNKIKALLRKA